MSEQMLQILFSVVFLSQVLLISIFLPRQVLARLRFVVRTYPPAQFPKLYPVPMDQVEKAQRSYRNLNVFALLVGLAMVLAGLIWPGNEMFNGENDFVPMIYLMIQFSPILILATNAGITYFNPMRNTGSNSTRRAELTPRRVFDFVSPALLGVATFVYVAFIVLIVYVRQFEFPWFGGYSNLVGVTAINLAFAGVAFKAVYGKRKDPYQAHEDRTRQMEATATLLLWTSIAATLFIALAVTLRAFELSDFLPVSMSLYFQLVALMSFREFRIDNVNFEVYREDPVAT